MAKATEKWTTVQREIVKVVNESVRDGLTLELNHEEARFLSFILARIGGSPTNTARGLAERISETIGKAGYSGWYPNSETEEWTEKGSRAIYFTTKSVDVFKREA